MSFTTVVALLCAIIFIAFIPVIYHRVKSMFIVVIQSVLSKELTKVSDGLYARVEKDLILLGNKMLDLESKADTIYVSQDATVQSLSLTIPSYLERINEQVLEIIKQNRSAAESADQVAIRQQENAEWLLSRIHDAVQVALKEHKGLSGEDLRAINGLLAPLNSALVNTKPPAEWYNRITGLSADATSQVTDAAGKVIDPPGKDDVATTDLKNVVADDTPDNATKPATKAGAKRAPRKRTTSSSTKAVKTVAANVKTKK